MSISCEQSNQYKTKDPDARLDYGVNWGEKWLNENDTIVASEWIIPVGITGDNDSFSSVKTMIFLSGGTVGETYIIVNRITTNVGLINDASIFLSISEQ